MIAKRITSKAAKPRMARLVKYVVAAQGSLDPRSWTRTADYMLASGTSNRGEKVGGVRVTNCNTDDPAAATTLIEATQAANTRSRTDKTYHLVFSFPPGENPPLEILHKIEDELVASIGFADHQRISAVHVDCDHLHVHVAINKVHPKGFQNIEPYFDKNKLMEACERLELEHGLRRTNHGLTGEVAKKDKPRLKTKPAEIEAHANVESLTGFVIREVAPSMHKAENWQDLHGILADHGLTIKLRGAGLVIGSGAVWVKASQCDRSFSMKAFTDKFGPFEPSKTRSKKKPYDAKPRQQHPSSAALYAKYQQQRNTRIAARKNALAQVRYECDLMNYQLKKWYVAQKLIIKLAGKGPVRRATLKILNIQTQARRQRNWEATNAKRRQVITATATPVWAQWLTQQAENGNQEALAVLRSRGEWKPVGNVVTSANTDTTQHTILHALKPHIEKDGSVAYGTTDGGLVIDRKAHVQALRATAGSTLLALELASKRFAGQPLIVEGTDEFKAQVAKLAALHNINVRVADPVRQQGTKSTDRGIEL